MQINSNHSIIQLTWLRGVAALLVVFSHICRCLETQFPNHSENDSGVFKFLDLGSFGVALFFTLSGCTLYLSVSEKGFTNYNSYFIFYLKRFFRVWPAFFIALVIYLIAGVLFKPTLIDIPNSWIASHFIKEYSFIDVSKYALFIFNITGPQEFFNNAFWSLPIEFQYYLMLPLVFILIKKINFLGPLVLSIVMYSIYKSDPDWIDSKLVFWLAYTFFFGAYIGYLYKNITFSLPSNLAWSLIIIIYLFLIFFQEGYFNEQSLPSEWNVYGLSAVTLVALVIFSKITLPKPVAFVFKFYGEVSYSLYLYHNFVLGLLIVLYIKTQTDISNIDKTIFPISALALSSALAFLGYKLIELHSIRLGRICSDKFKK